MHAGVTSVGIASATVTVPVPTRLQATAAAALQEEIRCERPFQGRTTKTAR